MNKRPIIETIGVTKRYNSLTAVDNLDLSVPQGVCFGLLGPNGAGKTTLVEMIEGIISPTSGQVLYEGKARDGAFHEKIGIMFQQTTLFSFMNVYETLKAFEALYPRTMDIEALINLCYLDDIRKQYNDKLSGGQRQRLLLALALINQPEILFLDEPSTGLDPQARRNLWDIVTRVKSEGKTIILTTHYMEEAEYLCDIVAIVDNGRIIAQGSPQTLIESHTQGVNIVLPADRRFEIPDQTAFDISIVGEKVVIKAEDANAAVQFLIKEGVDLTHLSIQTPTLETVFLNLTGRKLRD